MAVADAPFATPTDTQPFEHLVLDFLAYLEFERGLSRNTLEAYRSDLLQYGVYLHGRDALTVTHSDLAGFVSSLAAGDGEKPPVAPADVATQGRVPALVLPAPAPPGRDRGRPDREPARTQAEPSAPARAQPRRGRASCSSSRAAPSRRRCATGRCSS